MSKFLTVNELFKEGKDKWAIRKTMLNTDSIITVRNFLDSAEIKKDLNFNSAVTFYKIIYNSGLPMIVVNDFVLPNIFEMKCSRELILG